MLAVARLLYCLFVISWAMSLSGCAARSSGATLPEQHAISDPFEGLNRATHGVNQIIDQSVFKPAAKIYQRRLPQPLRLTIRNFFQNLGEPTTIVNDLLQGRGGRAVTSGARFAINTTLGLFGLMDLATTLGFPRHQEDYGQTLALWGVPSGPYLVLPVLGPSNVRDLVGKLPALFLTDPLLLITDEPFLGGGRYGLLHAGFRTLHAIDLRAQLLPLDSLIELQVDPYSFLQESYRQKRHSAINDGAGQDNQVPRSVEKALFND